MKKLKYFSLIFVPSGKDEPISVSMSYLKGKMFLLFLLLYFLLIPGLLIYHVSFVKNASKNSQSIESIKRNLDASNSSMKSSLELADNAIKELVGRLEKQEVDYNNLETRYATLSALVEGQEEIALAHKAILTEGKNKERIIEIGLSIFAGVIATLLVSLILTRFKVDTATNEKFNKKIQEEKLKH